MNARKHSIIYVADNRLALKNAAIMNIVEMCGAFSKTGIRTTLMVPDCGTSRSHLFAFYGVLHPFDVIKVPLPKIFIRRRLAGLVTVFSWKTLFLLRNQRFDLVYTRTTWIFFMLAVLIKRKCVFEAHQYRFNGKIQTFIYRKLVKLGMRSKYGSMVCISAELKKQWLRECIHEKKIFVAHDGVNLNRFHAGISKAEARQILGLGKNRQIVVYTGSIIPGKGVETLVRCASNLPEVLFVIVGGEKEQVEKLGALSLRPNLIFPGRVPPVKVPIYQAAADILALPNGRGSAIDDVTSPMKLFEYIASARPIVATDIPSVLEILKDRFNSLISPVNDSRKLSENIRCLLLNPSLCQELVQNALQDIKKYTWDTRVQSISRLIFEAM